MVDALLSVASQLAEEDGEDFQIFAEHGTPSKTSSSPVRQCEFCKSTETPAWRRGPAGKGSLCNACGIKLRLKKKVKKNDDLGRSDVGKKMSGMRKTVGRPPKKHPKLLKQFTESKKFFCKSCNLPTDSHNYKAQFEMCRNCSKRREDRRTPSDFPRYRFNSSASANVTIDHDRYRAPRHDQETIVARKLDVYEFDHVREGLQNMKSELLIQQELVEHEDQLANLRLSASRELNELKLHAISRIREFERLRIAQVNTMVGSLIANISACEQFQQEIIGRARLM